MAGLFDDLIPATSKVGAVNFQDLIPKRNVDQDVAGFMANVNRGLGIGDELAAGINTAKDVVTGNSGPNVVQTFKDEMGRQRQTEDSFTQAHPHVAALGRGTGNALTMAAPAGPGAAAFANGGRAVNALRGAVTAGLTGAGYAAVDRGTAAERLHAASAAAVDPVTLGLGAGAGALATARPSRVQPEAPPSLDQLTAQKNAAYQAVDDSGVAYSPDDFKTLTGNMIKTVADEGFNPGLHPKTAAMLDRVSDLSNQATGHAPTLTQLDQLRQQIGRDVASSPDPGERRMGTLMRNQIDQFIENSDVGGDLVNNARDLNTRVSKLRSLDDLDNAAENRASVTGSGGNINNATRQNVLRFMNNTGNLTPAEQAAAQTVVSGTPAGNALRQVGKLSPEGNGLMAGAHLLGAAATHGVSAGVAGAGYIAKRASDAITARNVQALRDLIASGGQAATEVARQLADPQYSDLLAQLANDLVVQGGVQGASAAGASR